MNTLTDWANQLPDAGWNAIVGGASLILGIVAKSLIHRLLNFTTKRSDYILFKSIVNRLATPAYFFIPLLFFNISLTWMRLEDKSLLSKLVEIALLASFAFVLAGVVKVFEDIIYYKNDLSQTDNLKARKIRTQIEWVSRMAIIIIVVVTVAAILLSFDSLRKIGTGLLAGVGVGGIIIGFAAQSSLSNLLAGFQIAFTQPIRLDDVVVLEGEWGKIEDIALTYVVVKIWDERRLILPIRYFIEKPFQNWTRINAEILGTVFLYLDYSVPVQKIREKFDSLLEASPLWDKKTKAIQVTDSKEKTIEIRALMSAKNSSDSFDLRCYVREHLISFLQTEYPGSFPRFRAEITNLKDLSFPEPHLQVPSPDPVKAI